MKKPIIETQKQAKKTQKALNNHNLRLQIHHNQLTQISEMIEQDRRNHENQTKQMMKHIYNAYFWIGLLLLGELAQFIVWALK